MISTFKNAWKIPNLRKKMLFTLFMLLIYRFGSHIPVPFMNAQVIQKLFNGANQSVFALIDLMSGGSLSDYSIFAANIYPYITASIVLQLLTIAIPSLEALSKEGETGRKTIAKYTRYLAIAIALVQALGYSFGFYGEAVMATTLFEKAVIVLSIVGGSAFLIWIGEQITEHGVGNGISLIIFAGIIARFPVDIVQSYTLVKAGRAHPIFLLILLLIVIAIIVFVVTLNEGERRIPVQYAKRVVGRKMYGGQSTHLPIKVLMSGVMPMIFASSIVAIPATFATFSKDEGFRNFVLEYFTTQGTVGTILYIVVTVLLIVFFTFFYTSIQFNTVEYSKQMQQNGGFIPGIRSGRPTSDYLQRTVNRLVFPGAIALAILAILPVILTKVSGLPFAFGGTSMIIVVGVILETTRTLEQQLLMRHYKGFLNK
ncbi:preprotein translocase subunit SecY [Peptoniphilus equinus]|uniref:Protein translocase subunit SecY n=1 Tax=Peptoniphilus equinus TaxID=3016343 RepID=A0ABY7QS57_9FIRM|nr:preprotein translocase subunit SecY [Peptoniphilus equinus]WBW49625.1 preprotein translocase subunit SecY [Peptoniphilus equinus]